MKIPRQFLALLILLGVASSSHAQAVVQTFARNYDLNATSYTYCATTPVLAGNYLIETSGSSVTTVASDAVLGVPFAALAVGDDVYATPTVGGELRRIVVTKTSSTSIDVDSAWNLGTTGVRWNYRHRACGTAATDGWLNVGPQTRADVKVDFVTLTGTDGVDVSIECRFSNDATLASQIYTANYSGTTAPTNSDVIPIGEDCASIRVGLKWRTADTAGTDVISAFLYTEVK